LAARCAGLALASKAGPPTTNSVGFPPLTSSWSLTDGDKVTLSTVRSALLYVAACAPSANLAGSTLVEQAQVDSWLSTLYHQLDWPLSVALAEKAGGAPSTEILTTILAQLEAHFLYQTYLVGHTVTVADLCLAASLTQAKTAGLWNADASPNLIRWYQTLINAPWWSAAAKAPVATAGGMHLHGVPTAVHSHLYRRRRIRVKEILADASYVGQTVTVAGWARTVRKASSKLLFIQINDGSVGSCLQCVLDAASCAGFEDCKKSGGTGASFMFTGTLAESKGSGQAVELKVTTGELLGAVFAGNAQGTEVGGAFYPMSKKEHTLEYLREQAHLRPRAAVHAAVMRIRHSMAYATHNFFHSHGFLYIHTPILTGADCEGAGEQFGVTSLLGSDHLKTGVSMPVHPVPEVKEMSKSEMKRLAKKKKKGTEDTKVEEEIIPGAVDYSKDFFGQRVNLTVSGQLNVETHACALSDVYTFGPTFRAEYSFTSRHLSEFWMIEPEIAFANLTDDINLAEDYLKYCVQFALENCAEDLEFFENSPHGEEGLRARLQNVIDSPFKVSHRSSYGEYVRRRLVKKKKYQWESLGIISCRENVGAIIPFRNEPRLVVPVCACHPARLIICCLSSAALDVHGGY
jgi:aspartyl/asparaginyl-tRNA synthetase